VKRLVIFLLCSVVAFASVSAGDIQQLKVRTDITSYTFVGGVAYKHDGIWDKQAIVGAATQVSGPIWGLVRGGIGEGEGSIEVPEVSYWRNYRGFRFGVLAALGAAWQGNETLVTYLTGAAGFCAGYIDEHSNKGIMLYGRYKEGSDHFVDGVRVGAAFVF
jgi:hypothetical protein